MEFSSGLEIIVFFGVLYVMYGLSRFSYETSLDLDKMPGWARRPTPVMSFFQIVCWPLFVALEMLSSILYIGRWKIFPRMISRSLGKVFKVLWLFFPQAIIAIAAWGGSGGIVHEGWLRIIVFFVLIPIIYAILKMLIRVAGD